MRNEYVTIYNIDRTLKSYYRLYYYMYSVATFDNIMFRLTHVSIILLHNIIIIVELLCKCNVTCVKGNRIQSQFLFLTEKPILYTNITVSQKHLCFKIQF